MTVRVLLGIDPGSRVTGYGVIRVEGGRVEYLDSGCIRAQTLKDDIPARLLAIFNGIQTLAAQYQPDEVAVEDIFVAHNVQSALKLGHARGAAIVAATAAALPVFEYSARQVKQAIVGYGNADKSQVQHMVQQLLGLDKVPASDAADALAVALCHWHSQKAFARVGRSRSTRGRIR